MSTIFGEKLEKFNYQLRKGVYAKAQEPIEEDHFMQWIELRSVPECLEHDHHIWAIKKELNF